MNPYQCVKNCKSATENKLFSGQGTLFPKFWFQEKVITEIMDNRKNSGFTDKVAHKTDFTADGISRD